MKLYQSVDPILRDPRPRLSKDVSGPLVNITVSVEVQEFFAKLMNHVGKRSDWFSTCITCLHWQSVGLDQGRCGMFNVVPPPRVIADGCKYYEDGDQIPF